MEIETLVVILLTAVVAVVGFLLKDLLKGIKTKLDGQDVSMDKMLSNSTDFKIDLVKINGSLDNIKSEQSQASDNIKETRKIVFSNTERITSHGHEIAGIKNNFLGYTKLIEEFSDKLKKIEAEKD